MRALVLCLLISALSLETLAAPPFWRRICGGLWRRKAAQTTPVLRGTWISPDPAAADFSPEQVIDTAKRYFTIRTFQMNTETAASLTRILVLASPKKFGVNATDGDRVLGELLSRFSVVLLALKGNEEGLHKAHDRWFNGDSPQNDEETNYFAYFDQSKAKVHLPGVYALTRRVREFKEAQKFHLLPSEEISPLKLGSRWLYRLRTAGEIVVGAIPFTYGVGAVVYSFYLKNPLPMLGVGAVLTATGLWIIRTSRRWSQAANLKDSNEIDKLRARIVDLQLLYSQQHPRLQTLLVIADDPFIPEALEKAFMNGPEFSGETQKAELD